MPPSTARSTYPAKYIDDFAWETDLPVAPDFRGNKNRAPHRQRTRRRRGRHRALELSVRGRVTKLAQALATGNTVVLKPAPDTPWNATLLGSVVAENTDIPPGSSTS